MNQKKTRQIYLYPLPVLGAFITLGAFAEDDIPTHQRIQNTFHANCSQQLSATERSRLTETNSDEVDQFCKPSGRITVSFDVVHGCEDNYRTTLNSSGRITIREVTACVPPTNKEYVTISQDINLADHRLAARVVPQVQFQRLSETPVTLRVDHSRQVALIGSEDLQTLFRKEFNCADGNEVTSETFGQGLAALNRLGDQLDQSVIDRLMTDLETCLKRFLDAREANEGIDIERYSQFIDKAAELLRDSRYARFHNRLRRLVRTQFTSLQQWALRQGSRVDLEKLSQIIDLSSKIENERELFRISVQIGRSLRIRRVELASQGGAIEAAAFSEDLSLVGPLWESETQTACGSAGQNNSAACMQAAQRMEWLRGQGYQVQTRANIAPQITQFNPGGYRPYFQNQMPFQQGMMSPNGFYPRGWNPQLAWMANQQPQMSINPMFTSGMQRPNWNANMFANPFAQLQGWCATPQINNGMAQQMYALRYQQAQQQGWWQQMAVQQAQAAAYQNYIARAQMANYPYIYNGGFSPNMSQLIGQYGYQNYYSPYYSYNNYNYSPYYRTSYTNNVYNQSSGGGNGKGNSDGNGGLVGGLIGAGVGGLAGALIGDAAGGTVGATIGGGLAGAGLGGLMGYFIGR